MGQWHRLCHVVNDLFGHAKTVVPSGMRGIARVHLPESYFLPSITGRCCIAYLCPYGSAGTRALSCTRAIESPTRSRLRTTVNLVHATMQSTYIQNAYAYTRREM